MKKIILTLCMLTLILCNFSTVSADELDTPWTDPNIKVHVFEDFSSYGNMDLDQFADGFSLESDAMTHFMRIKDEKLDFYAGGKGNMFFNYKLSRAVSSKAEFANAKGFAFYIENNTPGDIIIGLQSKNSDKIQYICTAESYCYDLDLEELYLADTDDTWDVHCMPIIPAQFRGYIIFPFESIAKRIDGDLQPWDENDYMDSLGLIVRGGVLNDDENMIIDNLFIYGDVKDNNNGRVYLNGAPEETLPPTTEAPTDTPEPIITDSVTSEPGNATNPPESAKSDLTWVYIVMVAVVVVGVVAIVLVLKKKK